MKFMGINVGGNIYIVLSYLVVMVIHFSPSRYKHEYIIILSYALSFIVDSVTTP